MVEVCNSVQAAVTKLIQEKNKLKEAKLLSDDTLQIPEEEKGKAREKGNTTECRSKSNS